MLYVRDAHGDVTSLLDATDLDICNPVDENEFDAFGNGGANNYSRMGYAGQYHDAETGFIYLRARYYSPAIGRFINEDPIRDSLNWYVYCNNNPVNFVDPSGNFAVTAGATLGMGVYSFFATYGGYILASVFGAITGTWISNEINKTSISETQSVVDNDTITTNDLTNSQTTDVATTTDETISKTDNNGNHAYFPKNPYDFNPKGLVRKEYSGSGNGKIIKWQDPTSKVTIFEWDEDLEVGSHYHIVVNEGHTGDHILAGTPVPFPYDEVFFGG